MNWPHVASRCIAVALLSLAVACNRPNAETSERAEPYTPAEGAVGFDIQRTGLSQPRSWVATYNSSGKIARFRIELGPATDKTDKDFRLSLGKGKFMSEDGSDASVFLVELKKALEAKTLPPKVKRVPSVDFDYVMLGEDLSRDRAGGLSGDRRGNWMAAKVFLAGGEGEVFMNLNPVLGKGEFSIKDSDYGDIVLAELAKVL